MIYVASSVVDNDEIIKGNRCVTSPKELYECIIQNDTTEIIIREDFYKAFFTPSGLTDFISNLKGLNPSIRVTTEFPIGRNIEQSVRHLKSLKSLPELIYVLETQPEETIKLINTLCDDFLGTYNETLVANNRVSSLHMQNSKLLRQLAEQQDNYEQLMSERNEAVTKLHQLISRINYSYDKNVDEATMLEIDGCKYDKVLYIKEITRVHYTDTFIYYLQEILRTLYGVPARVLVIEPYYAYHRARLYPELKKHWELKYADVYESDIFMAGFQPELAKDIMQNSSAYNYLIVLDRDGLEKPHLVHEKVEVLYTCSDLKDLPTGIDPTRVITYNGEHLAIDYIPDFDKLTSEQKIASYSSMPMMKAVIELMERR